MRKRAKLTDAATMKAVIWFRVIPDAQTPRAVSWPARRTAPMYWARTMPGSASDTRSTPSAVGTVPASASRTKAQSPRNLPTTSSVSVSGCASTHSSVLLLRSSASVRMVAAGTKTAKRMGRRSKMGLSEATPVAYIVRNARKSVTARNATMSTYAVG